MSPAPHRLARRKLDVLLLAASLILIGHACGPQHRLMKTERSPLSPIIAGSGSVTQDGLFRFRLADPLACTQDITEIWCLREDQSARKEGLASTCAEKDVRRRTESLSSCAPRIESLRVEPPWGKPVRADVGADGNAVFTIDWAMSPIDPLADDAPQAAKQPWFITSTGANNRIAWVPTSAEISTVLAAIGKAKDIDISEDPSAQPALIAIKSVEVDGEALRPGQENRITLTLQNSSPGPAYRVIARTRSGHPALHDLKFLFGRINGGKEMTRTLTVTLPAAGNEENPMVVVRASGANVTNVDRNQRLPIRAAPKLPPASIALRCWLADQADPKTAIVESGKRAAIWCEVQNTGELAVQRVKLTAKGSGRRAGAAIDKAIAPDQNARVQIYVPIPASARVGSELTLQLSAVAGKASAKTSIKAKVVFDRACPDGLLTRPQFAQKRAKLKELLTQGVLAQEEFDNYEAELLRCLK